MWCFVELPSCEGELCPAVLYQFTVLDVEEHELQMDQLGDSSAYPEPQPDLDSRS